MCAEIQIIASDATKILARICFNNSSLKSGTSISRDDVLVDVKCPISLLQELAVAGVAREVARHTEKSMVHVRQTSD